MKESEFRNTLIEALRWHKFQIIRVHPGARQLITGGFIHGPEVGTFDYVIGYPKDGTYLLAFMEAKQGRDSLNPDQIRFARNISKIGIPWLVASDTADVDEWIKDYRFHGKLKNIECVFDENKVFVPPVHRAKRAKMDAATVQAFNRWADKREAMDKLQNPPF